MGGNCAVRLSIDIGQTLELQMSLVKLTALMLSFIRLSMCV